MPTLSGFVDEALLPFTGQLDMAARLGMTHVDLRRIGRHAVPHVPEAVLARTREQLLSFGLSASCVATRIGKSAVTAPLGRDLESLRRAAAIAHRFGTPYVRVFSWYTPDPSNDRGRTLTRMNALVELAEVLGVTLVHENEKGVYGDTPERCQELVDDTSGGLRLIFDPANFVQCGVLDIHHAWQALAPHVDIVHAKDAHAATGRVVRCGRGAGMWRTLAGAIGHSSWDGFISLEPHLGLGGRGGPVGRRTWESTLIEVRRLLRSGGVTLARRDA